MSGFTLPACCSSAYAAPVVCCAVHARAPAPFLLPLLLFLGVLGFSGLHTPHPVLQLDDQNVLLVKADNNSGHRTALPRPATTYNAQQSSLEQSAQHWGESEDRPDLCNTACHHELVLNTSVVIKEQEDRRLQQYRALASMLLDLWLLRRPCCRVCQEGWLHLRQACACKQTIS